MSCILINDIFDELKEENNRLLNEIKEISDLLSNYRNVSLNFQEFCVCNQKTNYDIFIQSLEEEYQKFANQRIIKTEIIESLEKTSEDKQISSQTIDENNDESEGNECVKSAEESDTDYELSYGNEIRIKNICDEEITDVIKIEMIETFEDKIGDQNSYEESAEDMDTEYEVNDGNDTQINYVFDEEITETQNPGKSEKPFVCYYIGCKKTYKRRVYFERHIALHSPGEVCPHKLLNSQNNCPKETTHLETNDLNEFQVIDVSKEVTEINEMNNFLIKSLEEYQKKQNKENIIESEIIDKPLDDKQISPSNGDEYEGNKWEEWFEDVDTDCEVSDGNDTQINDISETKKLWKFTRFSCNFCNKTFKSKQGLNKHKELVHTFSHNPTLSLKCEECHTMFSNWRLLVHHQMANHKKPGLEYCCNYIGCDFRAKSKSGMSVHMTASHSSKYNCQYNNCDKLYPNYMALLIHQSAEHKEPGIRCDFKGCHKLFKTDQGLLKHKRTPNVHIDLITLCDYPGGGQEFENTSLTQTHLKEFHKDDPIVCDWSQCGNTYQSIDVYREHRLTHTMEKQIPCKVEGCPKILFSVQQLHSHMAKHREVEYKCSWSGCEQTFKVKDHLVQHINKEHKKCKPYKCPFEGCHKDFYCLYDLKIHKKYLCERRSLKKPRNTRPVHKCNECNFVTIHESLLRGHITRVHPEHDFTVECTDEGCHKIFRSKKSMQKHRNTVHTHNKLDCDRPQSDFSAPQTYRLVDHKRLHIPNTVFKCEFEGCAQSFITRNDLSDHTKSNHLSSFVCSWPECGQPFDKEITLTAHMNRHLNLRPFKCYFDDCDKEFRTERFFKNHIKTVHKIKPNDKLWHPMPSFCEES